MDSYTRQWLGPAVLGFILLVAAIIVQFYIGWFIMSFGMVMFIGITLWVILFVEPPPGGVVVKGRTVLTTTVTFASVIPWLHFAGLLYQDPIPLLLAALITLLLVLSVWNDFIKGRARAK